MQNKLYRSFLRLPASELGPEATLPPIFREHNFQAEKVYAPSEDDELYTDLGRVGWILPYSIQNGYTRQMKTRDIPCIILENDLIQAVFLDQYGGRLWSLTDKTTGKNLLYTNDILRFSNLALRNAWFSGGIEWNIGMIGHSPFTCAPLHTAFLTEPNGRKVLRLYEYERIREVYYQMDFFLDDRKPVLYLRVRIKNPHTRTIPMYWWTNMTLPEEPGARLVVPASRSFCSTIEGIDQCGVPFNGDTDITYPTETKDSKDYFFRVEERHRRYIAYYLADGSGFFQTSTFRQRGRKLFVWGQGHGSDTWQHWLTQNAGRYVELQAGLCKTQYECMPMPPCAAWEWMEAFGPLNDRKNRCKGDYAEARRFTESAIEAAVGEEELEQLLTDTKEMALTPAQEMISYASGWGALEELRRREQKEPPLAPHLDFGPVGPKQSAWKELLLTGKFPEDYRIGDPAPTMVSPRWKEMLARSDREAPGWHSAMHLGMMDIADSDPVHARRMFLKSNKLRPNPFACYGLAVLADSDGNKIRCIRYCRHLLVLIQPDISVLRDVCRLLLRSEDYSFLIRLLKDEPLTGQDGRLKLFLAQAYSALDRPDEAEALLRENGGICVADLREGELELSELFFRIKKQQAAAAGIPYRPEDCELPDYLNFRLKADE